MGATSTAGASPDKPDKCRPKFEPQAGELTKFSTAVTPQSKAWLERNATKYNCRHTVVGGNYYNLTPIHLIVSSEDKIKSIFANKDAPATGLFERASKRRGDAGDSGNAPGRELTKPAA